MKKKLSILLISAMALAITACGGKDKVGEASPPVQTPEVAAEAAETAKAEGTESKVEDAKGEEANKSDSAVDQAEGAAGADVDAAGADTAAGADAAAEAGTEEDGQNPTMNFVGPYTADKAEMMVEASDKKDAQISISQKSDAGKESVWTMSGEFNEDTFSVEYTDGKKTEYEYADDGTIKSETVTYEDGTGRIIFNPQDGTCVWEDEKEHVADALIFEFNYPATEVPETGELG